MARAKLDRIDRRILSDLQSNGRMTNVELAERAGISAPPCLRRVRALERAGIIKGYHAELSPEALGYSVSVFALVGLNSQAEADLKAFEELIAKWEEVRECHMLAGETDFLLRVVARDWDAYQRFVTEKLTAAPKVAHVKSALAIRSAKTLPGVPIAVDGDKPAQPPLAMPAGVGA
jgi:DNA-binding Lrp family transcriptional regulator